MNDYYNNGYNNEPRKKMFLDIETLPAPEHMHEVLREVTNTKKRRRLATGRNILPVLKVSWPVQDSTERLDGFFAFRTRSTTI